jgi:hypothetical protein
MLDQGSDGEKRKQVGHVHPETARLLSRVASMMAAYGIRRREIQQFAIRCSGLSPEAAEQEAQMFFLRHFESGRNGIEDALGDAR